MAYGALREIGAAGLRVPDDIAVIGFDDQPLSELMDLSTIRQPVADQALDVAARLLALIGDDQGDDAPSEPAAVLPTDLVVRGSTAVAARP
jgi:DNA-binding LacI/PurR family transcriptional regulator